MTPTGDDNRFLHHLFFGAGVVDHVPDDGQAHALSDDRAAYRRCTALPTQLAGRFRN